VTQVVDPTVSKAKFKREIREFQTLEAEYRKRGWFLVHAEFPKVLVVLAAPQLNPPALVTGVAFDYTNYDAEPPAVRLVNPFTAEPYPAAKLPTQLLRAVPGEEFTLPGLPPGARVMSQQALVQFHSPDDVPFLCIAGVREYHQHPGHSGDLWELHRATGAGRLVRLLEIIYKYGVQSIAGYNVTLVPQVNFQVGQVPE